MVVLALLRKLGFWAPLEAHHANLPRLAQARSLGAIASALTPILATPPASVFAATGVLVLVVLLLHFCAECLFPLARADLSFTTCYPVVRNCGL